MHIVLGLAIVIVAGLAGVFLLALSARSGEEEIRNGADPKSIRAPKTIGYLLGGVGVILLGVLAASVVIFQWWV